MLTIRNTEKKRITRSEEITRNAFIIFMYLGCVEHYLVHIMRQHEDFIPALDFVAELDGQVIGNIMYARQNRSRRGGL